MESQKNKQCIRDYLDLFNRDWRKGVDTYVTDASLREHIIVFEEGLPDYEVHEEDLVAEGDRVALRGYVLGRHTGTLFGVPATGRQVRVPLIIIYQIADGKIVDHWMQADSLGLMQQIGAFPEPVEAV